jgi:hypothetical protein
MFITNINVVEGTLPRMTVSDIDLKDHRYICLNHVEQRKDILVHIKGTLYSSSHEHMVSNRKDKIDERANAFIKKLKLDRTNDPIFFVIDKNDNVELVSYVSKAYKLIAPLAGTPRKGSFHLSLIPPNNGKCAIVYRYNSNTDVEFFFLPKQNPLYLRQGLALIAQRFQFHKANNPTATGIFIAMCLASSKYGLPKPSIREFNYIKQLISYYKGFGHSGFSESLKDDYLYDLLYVDADLSTVPEKEIRLSEIIENPELVAAMVEATSVEVDICLEDMFKNHGRIREIYIEDSTLQIVTVVNEGNLEEDMNKIAEAISLALEGIDYDIIHYTAEYAESRGAN